jgi:hypothetical protein
MKAPNPNDPVSHDLSERKKIHKRLLLAVGLFVVSFFLPAFIDEPGYICACICMFGVWDGPNEWAPIAYYFPFTFSNVLMVIMPLLLTAVFKRRKFPVWLLIVQITLLVHVVSWPVSALLSEDTNAIGDSIKDIQVGYYIWLLSMVLMLWCTLRQRKLNMHTPELQVREAGINGQRDSLNVVVR